MGKPRRGRDEHKGRPRRAKGTRRGQSSKALRFEDHRYKSVGVQIFGAKCGEDLPYESRYHGRQETISLWTGLHALGFNVIPSHPLTKEPCRGWKEYQATRQPRWLFKRWFLGDFRLPGTSEAMLVVGDTPGIKVVVLDGDDDDAVALIRDRCPPTPMMTRTRRGCHFFYAHPGAGRIGQRTGTVIGGVRHAIDLKADGSVVVAPGSRHAVGHVYEMAQPWTPEMVSGLPVYDPSWLPHEDQGETKDRASARRPSSDHGDPAHQDFVSQGWLPPLGVRMGLARRYLAKVPGTRAGEGDARRECFRLSMILAWGFALPSDEAVACLLDWGQKDSNTDRGGGYFPWSEEEIAAGVRSASATAYRGKPGDRLFGA